MRGASRNCRWQVWNVLARTLAPAGGTSKQPQGQIQQSNCFSFHLQLAWLAWHTNTIDHWFGSCLRTSQTSDMFPNKESQEVLRVALPPPPPSSHLPLHVVVEHVDPSSSCSAGEPGLFFALGFCRNENRELHHCLSISLANCSLGLFS